MDQLLSQYGLPGIFILILLGGIGVLWRYIVFLNKKVQDIQDQRLTDAKETRDKLIAPMEQQVEQTKAQAEQSKRIYDLLLTLVSKKGS